MCHTQRSAHNAKQTNTVVILVSAVFDYRYKYNYTMICYRKMNTNTNTYKMSHTQQCVHDAKQSNTVVILVSSSHAVKKHTEISYHPIPSLPLIAFEHLSLSMPISQNVSHTSTYSITTPSKLTQSSSWSHLLTQPRNPYRSLHLSDMWLLNFLIFSLPLRHELLVFVHP